MDGFSNILFVVCTGLGALLVAIPLPKALASGNVGTSMLMIWIVVACLVQCVNTIRWNRNTENWAPAWCDFCGYFLVTLDVGLAASGVSINRRLYMIVTLDPGRHEAFAFNTVVDIVLCLVIPWASVTLQYVVQQYRFYIYEDVGCLSGVGTVNLAFPLVWMLPLFVGTISTGYACLTMRTYFRWNHQLTGEPGMGWWSPRLMALGVVSTMYGLVPTSISIALLATEYPVAPWPGWKAIHSTIGVIVYVPMGEWQSSPTQVANIELRRWTTVSLAFIVFVLLGLTENVRRMYWTPLRSIIEQTFTDQTRNRTVLDQNTDEHLNDQKAPLSSSFCWIFILCGKLRAERRQESLGLTDRPRLDSDVEASSQFSLPPPAVAHYNVRGVKAALRE